MTGPARPYRSKSVKPCDACRKRRVACIREEGLDVCSLCRHRKTTCTFLSNPQVRRKTHNSPTYPSYATLGPPTPTHSPSQKSSSGSEAASDLFEVANIEVLFAPCLEELVRLYYQYAHPSCPILGSQDGFQRKLQRHTVPGSLLAAVCLHGMQFWHTSPLAQFQELPNCRPVTQNLYAFLMAEARNPTLELLQTCLLYMHLPAELISTSTYTNTWGLSSIMVSMAQDLGLNVDPDGWQLPLEERKVRRLLWWAVYVNDKWMACWLERPSHIMQNTWDVKPSALLDFSDETGRLTPDMVSYATSFIALCGITELLSDTLNTFYGIRSRFDTMEVGDALSEASVQIERLRQWKADNPTTVTTGQVHHFASQMASYATCIAIHRALHGAYASAQRDDASSLVNHIIQSIRNDLFNMFRALKGDPPLGMWLCYVKGMTSMFGLSLAAIVQTSPDELPYQNLHEVLLEYRTQVQTLSDEVPHGLGTFGWAVNRLDPAIEELSSKGGSPSPGLGSSPDEFGLYAPGEPASFLATPPMTQDLLSEVDESLYATACS
ncbi:hypothetical protein GQ53DRAFT_827157 [Thozetella sp. PMI_491]|nr:hypothetical protein GQ53DRAFT_827157 [Thozetella sp. PMI_491]